MQYGRTRILTSFILCATLAAGGAAVAMQPAQTKPGLQAGGEVGASFTSGTRFAGAGDLDYGFHTGLLGQAYTSAVFDILSADRSIGGFDFRTNLLTLGVRQPLPIGGETPISVEGGLSYLDNGGNSTSTSGFIGGRATFGQGSSVGLVGMGRYHFENGGFYQVGGGIFGPIGKGSGLYYQADYFHLGGSGVLNSDSVLVGVRFQALP